MSESISIGSSHDSFVSDVESGSASRVDQAESLEESLAEMKLTLDESLRATDSLHGPIASSQYNTTPAPTNDIFSQSLRGRCPVHHGIISSKGITEVQDENIIDLNDSESKKINRRQKNRRRRMSLDASISAIQFEEQDRVAEETGGEQPALAVPRPANYRDFLKAQREMRMNGGGMSLDNDVVEEKQPSIGTEPDSKDPEKFRQAARLFQSMRTLQPKVKDKEEKAALDNLIFELETKMQKLDVDGHFKNKETLQAPFYSVPVQRQRWGDSQALPESNYGTLFFDLFFIGAIYNIQEMLLTGQAEDWLRMIIYFTGIFGPIFVTWEADVYFHSRYCVNDYAHRIYDVIRFIFVTMIVLFIQPLPELRSPQSSVAQFVLTTSIFLESVMHLLLNVEVYFRGQGDRDAITNHTKRKIERQLLPTSATYLAASIVSGIFYFVPLKTIDPLVGAWSIVDLPLTLTAFGYVSNILFTMIRKVRATHGSSDIRKTFVPNNIDYVIHRYNDWFLLLLGEVVMAIVEITDSERDYFVASMGALTNIVIHNLKFESEPHQAHGHALWRNMTNATCFSILTQVLSTGLIMFGIAYKILLVDGRLGLSDFYCTLFLCIPLAWVLVSLELMGITHKGLKKSWKRIFHENEEGLDVIYWPLIGLIIFKAAIIGLFFAFPWITNDVNAAVIYGVIAVVLMAVTRGIGWAFVYREEEIKHFVSETTRKFTSKVSFASRFDERKSEQGSASSGGLSHRLSKAVSFGGRASSRRFLSTKSLRRGSSHPNAELALPTDDSQDHEVSSAYGSASSLGKSRHTVPEVYDELFDAVVLIDQKGFIVTVNKTALEMFGYESKAELVGQNVSVLVGGGEAKNHDSYLKAFHGKDKERTQIGRQRLLKARRKDRSEFPCIIGIKKTSNGKFLIGYIRDMTDIGGVGLRSTQSLGSESLDSFDNDDFEVAGASVALDGRYRKYLKRILDDRSFDCIIVADSHGVIQGVNETMVREFGYPSKDALVGENLSILIGDPDTAERHDGYISAYRRRHDDGKRVSKVLGNLRSLKARRHDGGVFNCIIGVHDVDDCDLLVGYIRNLDAVSEGSKHNTNH